MSKKLIKVTIMSPSSSTEVQAEWLDVNTKSGNFVILPGHIPLITTLAIKKNLVIGLENGTQKIINVNDGILEVTRDTATIFLTNE